MKISLPKPDNGFSISFLQLFCECRADILSSSSYVHFSHLTEGSNGVVYAREALSLWLFIAYSSGNNLDCHQALSCDFLWVQS